MIYDPEGRYDPELYDHYPTLTGARDAALSSVELILDEGDYDGDDHRDELQQMLGLLESVETFEALSGQPTYQWFIDRLGPCGRPRPEPCRRGWVTAVPTQNLPF